MGFDAPITKGVCFVNMPASKTHIVQVIGRCLRVHPDKRCAQVILPLVAGAEGEDKRARDFMRVLAQTDARVAQALRNRGAPYVSVRRVRRAHADGSEGNEDEGEQNEQNAADLLYTAVYDATGTVLTDAWSTRYSELVAFYEANGTVPPCSAPGGLGRWVDTQRCRRATMPTERKARLESLEWWAWSVRAAPVGWDVRFGELVAYHAEHGRIPPVSTPGLGPWVVTQRQARATMTPERKERLEALEWWAWSVRAASVIVGWDARFGHLVAFYQEHGRLPLVSTSGLGPWVDKQRNERATMTPERKARLESLEWWVWSVHEAWSTVFGHLVAFYVANGRIPPRSTPGGLGVWVITQRHRRATITPERKARLEALPWWTWDTLEDAWSARYDELVAYHAEHGRIPPCSTPGGLGVWVATQHTRRATMKAARKGRLEALGWWVWRVRSAPVRV
jgi:hypothetical protein